MDTSQTPDPSLLPSAFVADELWVTSLVDPVFGGTFETLVLCDPISGLDCLQQAYASPASSHTLVMAMSLAHLRRLRVAIEAEAGRAEVVDARALGATREWPLWLSAHDSLFVALVDQSGEARSVWVCASTHAEAHAALMLAYPGVVVMGLGSLSVFQVQAERLERVLLAQDFGAISQDLRTAVERPATTAHLTAYPLAALGLFPTPAHAMAAHQAMFLDDEVELASGR